MSIQQKLDYHAQALADRALAANDPQVVQSILGSLTKSIQSGAVKPYVGIPLVESITQHLRGLQPQAAMAQATAPMPQVPPQGSIGAQALQQAKAGTNSGIDAAPSGLPTQMAAGGIVAFADGGDVESYAQGDYIVPSKSPAQMAKELEQYYVDEGLRQKYQPTPKEKLQQMLHLGADFPLSAATEQVRKASTQGPETPFDAAIKYYGANTPEGRTLSARKTAWTAGVADPFTGGVGINALDKQAAPAAVPAKDDSGIVIHPPTKAPSSEAPVRAPQVDVAPEAEAGGIDQISKLADEAKASREELKKLILGDDTEREKQKKIDILTQLMGAGFETMAGTSQHAGVNIGAGGKQLAQGIAQINAREAADKERRVGQLVQLGLKGSELDTELAKLGVTKDYYKAHEKLFKAQASALPSEVKLREAQARYYDRRPAAGSSGTAGMGSVSSAAVAAELNALEGYKADPKTAPFFGKLPQDVQIALTKTAPNTQSYQRAHKVFSDYADQYIKGRLDVMRSYGAKQPQVFSGLPE